MTGGRRAVALWAIACVLGGAVVAGAVHVAFLVLVYAHLPHLQAMRAACGAGAPQTSTGIVITREKCDAYFADLGGIERTTATQTAITGALATYFLLVLRFRVRPLERGARRPR